MRRHPGITRIGALLGLLVVAGCVDQLAGPEVQDPVVEAPDIPFFSQEAAPGLTLLTRFYDVPVGTSASEEIDDDGGRIELPQAGLIVEFPEDAIEDDVTITVTVIDSKGLAFEFAPHGQTFDEPVRLRFDLTDTELHALGGAEDRSHPGSGDGTRTPVSQAVGVYFRGSAGDAIPLETLPVYLENGELVIEIHHFSGYAVASG